MEVEAVAVKVTAKVEPGIALRMDPLRGKFPEREGKESAVPRAQAGCTLRCESDKVTW